MVNQFFYNKLGRKDLFVTKTMKIINVKDFKKCKNVLDFDFFLI
jgi:hypothetical protein